MWDRQARLHDTTRASGICVSAGLAESTECEGTMFRCSPHCPIVVYLFSTAAEMVQLWQEYEAGTTQEALFVKARAFPMHSSLTHTLFP